MIVKIDKSVRQVETNDIRAYIADYENESNAGNDSWLGYDFSVTRSCILFVLHFQKKSIDANLMFFLGVKN